MSPKRITQAEFRFSLEELSPVTGFPEQRRCSEVAQKIGRSTAIFNGIYIENPAHRAVFAALDEVRELGRNANGGRMFAVRNVAPSGSGKTAAALAYQRYVVGLGRHEAGQVPVIVVQLDMACTPKRLWSSILAMVGDPFCDRGTGDAMRRRAYDYLRRLNTQLLVIDEIQHLAGRATNTHDVSDGIKRVLDEGIAPLALFGTEAAKPMLERNTQLSNRMLPPCDIRRLDIRREADRIEFKMFVRQFDAEMVRAGLVKTSSGLHQDRTLSCLFEIADGVIGRVVNLLRIAFQISIRRSASFVELIDLAEATDTWAIAQGMIASNPFRYNSAQSQ